MPIYEFQCSKCSKCFETLIRKQVDEDSLVCPACGSKNLEKLVSACSMISHGGTTDGLSPSSGTSCTSCSSHNCSSCH